MRCGCERSCKQGYFRLAEVWPENVFRMLGIIHFPLQDTQDEIR